MPRQARIVITVVISAWIAGLLYLWLSYGYASRQLSIERFERQLVADIIPPQPLKLHGDILIEPERIDTETDETIATRPGEPTTSRAVCDAICAALLANPDVDSVTVVASKYRFGFTRFRLVDKEDCPGPSVVPKYPDSLRRPESEPAPNEEMSFDAEIEAKVAAARTLDSVWRERLSANDCIIADQANTPHAFSIRWESQEKFPMERYYQYAWAWTDHQLPIRVAKFEIRQANGPLLVRRVFVTGKALRYPVRPWSVGGCGILCVNFGYARETLRAPASREEFHPPTFLLSHTDLARGLVIPESDSPIADSLRRVLADSAIPSSDRAFGLADTWMRSLEPDTASDADVDLLAALISDRRVTEFLGVWHAVEALGDRAAVLREPIVARMAADFDKREIVSPLSKQLGRIVAIQHGGGNGANTRADGPSPAEKAILANPEKRLHADGLIMQQAQYGKAAVPLLTRIMREHVARTREARAASPGAMIEAEIDPIDAAMVALCRIGSEAKSAIPDVLALQSSWLSAQFKTDQRWQFTLARIGVPLSQIDRPARLNATEAQYDARLKAKLNRFSPDRDCRESWV